MGALSGRNIQAYAQVTDACDAACAHCGFACGGSGAGLLSVLRLDAFFDRVEASGRRIGQLALTGGEPMLFADRVYALAAAARARGATVRLITHAGWAEDATVAKRKVARLRAAGVSGLWIGAGFHHDERISPERTLQAVEAATDAGLACHLNHVYLHPLAAGMRGKGLCDVDGRIAADGHTARSHAAWQAQAGDGLSCGWARLWDRGRASALIDGLGPELAAEVRRDLARAGQEDPLPDLEGLAWNGRRLEGEF